MIELWCLDIEASQVLLEEVERAVPRLPTASSVASREPRSSSQRSVDIALRILLERQTGPDLRGAPFTRGRSGKPMLPSGFKGNFSVSHSAGRALFALSRDQEVGVDLEGQRRMSMSVARRAQLEELALRLAPGTPLPTDPDARTLQGWVRLEALAKAQGTGIGPLLTKFGIIGGKATREDVVTVAAGFTVRDLDPGAGLYAAIAARDLTGLGAIKRFPQNAAELETVLA